MGRRPPDFQIKLFKRAELPAKGYLIWMGCSLRFAMCRAGKSLSQRINSNSRSPRPRVAAPASTAIPSDKPATANPLGRFLRPLTPLTKAITAEATPTTAIAGESSTIRNKVSPAKVAAQRPVASEMIPSVLSQILALVPGVGRSSGRQPGVRCCALAKFASPVPETIFPGVLTGAIRAWYAASAFKAIDKKQINNMMLFLIAVFGDIGAVMSGEYTVP